MRDTQREAETQAEGEAGSMRGPWCGTRSRVSRIRPWAEGSAKPLSHLGCPEALILTNFFLSFTKLFAHSFNPLAIVLPLCLSRINFPLSPESFRYLSHFSFSFFPTPLFSELPSNIAKSLKKLFFSLPIICLPRYLHGLLLQIVQVSAQMSLSHRDVSLWLFFQVELT